MKFDWLFKESKVVWPKSCIGEICIGLLCLAIAWGKHPIAAFVQLVFFIAAVHFLVNHNNKKKLLSKF